MQGITIDDLLEIFGEVIDISENQIDINAVLGEDIPVDSRDMLRILSRIESRYRFQFEPSEVITFKTLGDVLDTVRRRVYFNHEK
jgi:acyl carrier protein